MEKLLKGRTTEGKWFVRPIEWAGEWNEKGELMPVCSTLLETTNEAMADQYMNVYKLIHLVEEEVNKMPEVKETLFVYDMDDCGTWVSDMSKEDTAKVFCEERGLTINEDIIVDDILECNQEDEKMYWYFDNNPEICMIIDKMIDRKSISFKKIEIGNLKCNIAYREKPMILIPYKDAIRLHGEYKKPYMIDCF